MAAEIHEQAPPQRLYGHPVNIDRGQSISVLQGAADPIPPAAPERTHRFCLAEHPGVMFTYAGDALFNKIQLRKRITVWPVQFKLSADYSRRLRAFQYGFSCKERLMKGSIHLDIPNQQLQYRKLLQMQGGGALSITGACNLAGIAGQQPLRPMIGLQWQMGHFGGVRISSGGQLDVRRKVPLTRNLGVEVCGNVEFPLPQAQYAVHDDESRFSFGGGDGTPFHVHLDQVNLRLGL